MGSDKMDPFNVVAAVFQGTKIVYDLVLFWCDSSSAPEEARELLYTVELLRESLKNVRKVIPTHLEVDDVEKKNHRSITNLLNKAERDICRLSKILPKPPEGDATKLQELRTHFARKLCEDHVRDIVSGIKLCNNALQVELQALTIFRLEEGKQHDHTSIQSRWDHVLNEADDLLSHRPFRAGDPDWDDCLDNFVSSLKEGASTSGDRSTIMQTAAPRRPSAMSSDWQSILSKAADSGIADVDDPGDVKEEPAVPEVLAEIVLQKTLNLVEVRLSNGKYAEAAGFQRSAMSYRQRFAKETPVPTEVMCRDEMKLADIYRRMGLPKWLAKSEETLVRVIDRLKTEELDDVELKNHLLAHLYHDLGRICLDLKRLSVASRHLTDAFELMVDSPSAPMPLLRSVGTMLYRIYINTEKPEVASSLDEHAEAKCGFSLKTLAWCQEQGFDTENETFKFDRCDSRPESCVKGLSPLHVAAKSAEDEVLRYMLNSRRLNLEVLEHQDNATPFLLACVQQDIVVVDLLLQYGARPTARDKLHRNGLHLCQRGTGGTGVARRLLSLPGAVDINVMDSYHNTALHLAASMGNSKMVLLLLSLGAHPNIRGPGGYTPLMAAVQATMKSQEAKLEVLKSLVERGADVSLEYSGGQTAADMANDGQIRKALKAWAKPKQSLKPARRFTVPWKS